MAAADLLVSTRFHPVVLALAAGVPAVAISCDRYTAQKLDGALAHAGLSGWRLPFHTVQTIEPRRVLDESWQRRAEIRAHLEALRPIWRAAHVARWDHVWQCLTVQSPPPVVGPSPSTTPLAPDTVDTAAMQRLEADQHEAVDRLERWALDAEAYAFSLRAALDYTDVDGVGGSDRNPPTLAEVWALQRRAAVAEATAADLRDEVTRAHSSADHARLLAAELVEQLRETQLALDDCADEVTIAYLHSLERELAALHATKLLRTARPFRAWYSRVRSIGARYRRLRTGQKEW